MSSRSLIRERPLGRASRSRAGTGPTVEWGPRSRGAHDIDPSEPRLQGFLLFAFGGFMAQLVDGSLGMSYGVTATSILFAVGISPAMTSASVHLAEIGTAAASGMAHYKLGNIDRRIVLTIGLPGAIGAFIGATVLTGIATAAARPWMALVLLMLGCYVLVRFTAFRSGVRKSGGFASTGSRWLIPLGALAGFLDATGGGGWGPVSTSTLLSTGKYEPRKVIGSVDAAELLIGTAATGGFLIGFGGSGLPWATAGALLAGGVVAAPIAAWLVRIMPMRVVGVAAGGMVISSNAPIVLEALGVRPSALLYLALISIWVGALGFVAHRTLVERRLTKAAASTQAPTEAPVPVREPEPVG